MNTSLFPGLQDRLALTRTKQVFALLLALAAGARAQQTAWFAAGQSSVPATGLSAPAAVATDSAGNLYIADSGNDRIEKITPAGVQSTVLTGTVLGKALKNPSGVAADGRGHFYVADSGNNRVLRISSGGVALALGSGLVTPAGIASDPLGNLFIADTGNNRIVSITPAGAQTTIVSDTYFQVGPQLSHPAGIGLGPSFGLYPDSYLYIVDTGNSRIISGQLQSGQFSLNEIFGTELKQPRGIAPSNQNTGIYVVDSGNNRLINAASVQYTVGGGFKNPGGAAADIAGNIYIADTGNNRIVKLQTAAVGMGTGNIAGATTQTLTFGFTGATTLNAKTPVVVSTQGAANLDFQSVAGGTCSAKTYNPGDSCTVNVEFKPTLAGERAGGVVLEDPAGMPLATAYLNGTGVGPQIAYGAGVWGTLAGGLSEPEGIAVDGAGNVYVANYGTSQIVKIKPAGAKSVFANIAYPAGLAIDGAGNLYTIASNLPAGMGIDLLVEEVTPTGAILNGLGVGGCQFAPTSVSVDSAANLYSTGINTAYWVKTTLTTTFDYGDCVEYDQTFDARGVAADSLGNIYVVDGTNWLVWKLMPAGAWSTVGSGFDRPAGVAVDSFNNVYVADFGNSRIVEISPAGVQSVLSAVVSEPAAVAVDGAGNIYIADLGDNQVVKIDRSNPVPLTFGDTPVGTTSQSSKELTIANIGNAAMTFPVPSTGKNASISANFTIANASTCPELSSTSEPAPLAAGSECNYVVSFKPAVAGAITGSLVVTDNNLNVANARQTIALKGTATAATVKLEWPAPAPIAAGTALSEKQLDAAASVAGKFAYSPVAGTKLAKGTHMLATTFTPTETEKYKTTTARVEIVVQ